MFLSNKFLLVLATVSRALFVAADFNVREISDPTSDILWHAQSSGADPSFTPDAIRLHKGTNILSAQNIPLQLQNADGIAGPWTDGGIVPNIKMSMAQSRAVLTEGGWGRTMSQYELPISTEQAGGNIGLVPGGTRILHWHETGEWGYVLKGEARVTCFTPEGQIWVDDVPVGDIWYFPRGYPHSIQAKKTITEFVIAFNEGGGALGSGTHSLQDWFLRTPHSVLGKNFGWTDPAILQGLPKVALPYFNATLPPENLADDLTIPNNTPYPYTYHLSKQTPITGTGGTVRIVDGTNFKVSTDLAVAEVTVLPGKLRELHWHPHISQWTYFIEGEARMTVFAPGSGNARTFNFVGGDVGFVPGSWGHYIQNTGNTTLKFLEVTRSDRFQDISAQQWLSVLPKSLVKAHFTFSDTVISAFKRTKQWVV